jgi:ABC-type nickel/cobalt efflux system permease component RcnA
MISPMASSVFDAGPSLLTALGAALVLGLRHSTDPDHLVAVSTLIAGARRRSSLAAARLGGAWGAGHALALTAFGLPVVLVRAELPERVFQVAEAAIGLLIVFLALQLLLRWRRGAYHFHPHDHDGMQHTHLHRHADTPLHAHAHQPPRTALACFFIGCLHGLGGSGAVGILLVAGAPGSEAALAALLVFAIGTAISMTALSATLGRVLAAPPVRRRFASAIPVLGTLSLLFGAWYGLGAWNVIPYPL